MSRLEPGTAFLGYSFRRGNPEPWKSFPVRHLLINAHDYRSRFRTEDGEATAARDLLGYHGYLLCDSGGYQVLQGSDAVDLASIMETQRGLDADLPAMLDNARDYRAHFRGLRSYLKEFGSEFLPVIPLDATDRQVRRFAEICRGYNIEAVGIGNFVPLVAPPTHYTKLEASFRQIARLRHALPMRHIHLFGVGGLTTGLIALLFADSIDTTSWVHDARYWKLRLPGGGVYWTRNTTTCRRRLPEGYHCRCPICRTRGPTAVEALDQSGFQARATHNAWVMLREYELAAVARRERRLRPFLERRLRRRYPHRNVYRALEGHIRDDVR